MHFQRPTDCRAPGRSSCWRFMAATVRAVRSAISSPKKFSGHFSISPYKFTSSGSNSVALPTRLQKYIATSFGVMSPSAIRRCRRFRKCSEWLSTINCTLRALPFSRDRIADMNTSASSACTCGCRWISGCSIQTVERSLWWFAQRTKVSQAAKQGFRGQSEVRQEARIFEARHADVRDPIELLRLFKRPLAPVRHHEFVMLRLKRKLVSFAAGQFVVQHVPAAVRELVTE